MRRKGFFLGFCVFAHPTGEEISLSFLSTPGGRIKGDEFLAINDNGPGRHGSFYISYCGHWSKERERKYERERESIGDTGAKGRFVLFLVA